MSEKLPTGQDDFIENIDDVCLRYDGGRAAANESLLAEIIARGLRKTTKETGIDRKTIRRILNRDKVRVSTLTKVVMGFHESRKGVLSYRVGEADSGDF